MSTTNTTSPEVTKAMFWSALCRAAHQDSGAAPNGLAGLLQTNSGWSGADGIDEESQILAEIFCPMLRAGPANRPFVVGHLAQSLDGCIAQADGESHWISGQADLDHTHRLRAFCDVVLVGAETVARDDCHLTVRHVDGPHPVRLVLDPQARLGTDRAVFKTSVAPTLWVVGSSIPQTTALSPHVEVLQLPLVNGKFDLHSLMSELLTRGCRRLFVEGGGVTISHFLKAGIMDRLHIAVAPILIGGGRPTIGQSLSEKLADCPRPSVRVHPMGADWLFDCDFGSESA